MRTATSGQRKSESRSPDTALPADLMMSYCDPDRDLKRAKCAHRAAAAACATSGSSCQRFWRPSKPGIWSSRLWRAAGGRVTGFA